MATGTAGATAGLATASKLECQMSNHRWQHSSAVSIHFITIHSPTLCLSTPLKTQNQYQTITIYIQPNPTPHFLLQHRQYHHWCTHTHRSEHTIAPNRIHIISSAWHARTHTHEMGFAAQRLRPSHLLEIIFCTRANIGVQALAPKRSRRANTRKSGTGTERANCMAYVRHDAMQHARTHTRWVQACVHRECACCRFEINFESTPGFVSCAAIVKYIEMQYSRV